jgi:diadenosine tetraphosphate (Ap4A) HIT family hydrolase
MASVAKGKGAAGKTCANMSAARHDFPRFSLSEALPMNQTAGFALDPKLAADSLPVGGLGLSDLRLVNDSRFPWLLLVPRRAGAAEIIDLGKADRAALFEEIATTSEALRAVTRCDKLNVGALGNQVRQLHVHIVARFAGDAAWPGPVWGSGVAMAYETDRAERLIAAMRTAVGC